MVVLKSRKINVFWAAFDMSADQLMDPFSRDEYERIDCIGHGSFAEITLEKNKKTGQLAAIKSFQCDSPDEFSEADFLREIAILGTINHPCIIPFYGFSYEANEMVYACRYFQKGSVEDVQADIMLGVPHPEYTPTKKSIIAVGIADAMRYLHDEAIPNGHLMHRDIKAANVMLDDSYHPFLGDFGFAKVVTDAETHNTQGRGSYPWMAPEVMKSGDYLLPADVFSYGMLLYELVYAHPPFPQFNTSIEFIVHVAEKKEKPDFINGVETEVCNLIKECGNYKPQSRPSFKQIVNALVDCKFLFEGTDVDEYKRFIAENHITKH